MLYGNEDWSEVLLKYTKLMNTEQFQTEDGEVLDCGICGQQFLTEEWWAIQDELMKEIGRIDETARY